MRYLETFLLPLFVLLSLASCSTSDASKKKNLQKTSLVPRSYIQEYGFEHNLSSRLIAKENGSKITLCALRSPKTHQLEEIRDAIQTWAAVINRHYEITFSCENYPSVTVYNREDPETEAIVNKWDFLKSRWNTEDLSFVGGDGRTLYNAMRKSMTKGTVLHEVGHLMGLCDQYPGGITNCAWTKQPVTKSIMANNLYFTSLQEDDKEGIRHLAHYYESLTKDIRYYANQKVCLQVKDKAQCQQQKCVWDEKNECLDSLLSKCSQASSELTCRQIVDCSWIQNSCMITPQR